MDLKDNSLLDNIISYIKENVVSLCMYVLLFVLLAIMVKCFASNNMIAGLGFCILPFAVAAGRYFITAPKIYGLFIFITSYFLSGLSRYVNIKVGVIFDVMLLYLLFIILLQTFKRTIEWKRVRNNLTYLTLLWSIFCTILLFNPKAASFEAWFTSVRWTAYYMFFLALLTPLIVTTKKDVKILINSLAFLTLCAVAKALMQKYYGFDTAEKYWLYVLEGARTHIIYSGIRYFSFFTDAANFGSSMGMSGVIFAVFSLYEDNRKLKWFYVFVAVAAFYGMMISGTRSSLVVPFVGLMVFVVLSKKASYIVSVSLFIVCAFVFFKYTNIGSSNQYIRRMRSAFDSSDPSLQVRYENQARMREFVKDNIFGVGIGLSGGKAKRFAPDSVLSDIPTDSWMVSLWLETGVFGIIAYLLMFFIILGYGAYLALFKLKDKMLRGIVVAVVCAMSGVLVNTYANEILAQFPNGVVAFTFLAVIYCSKYIDSHPEDVPIAKE